MIASSISHYLLKLFWNGFCSQFPLLLQFSYNQPEYKGHVAGPKIRINWFWYGWIKWCPMHCMSMYSVSWVSYCFFIRLIRSSSLVSSSHVKNCRYTRFIYTHTHAQSLTLLSTIQIQIHIQTRVALVLRSRCQFSPKQMH